MYTEYMALILMEDDNSSDRAFIIGLYELQRELAYVVPNKLFHMELDYLRKFDNIISYAGADVENVKIPAIEIYKRHDVKWKCLAQDCFEILIATLHEYGIEIRKKEEELVTYQTQYDRLDKTITELIRPALMAHAGNIEISYIRKHIVGLKLLGSCQGCPFSMQTLTLHIAKILGLYFPEFLIIHVTHFVDWDPAMADEVIS